jgi:hypothetical protein
MAGDARVEESAMLRNERIGEEREVHAPQWDLVGAYLYQLSRQQPQRESFVYQVRTRMGLPTDSV